MVFTQNAVVRRDGLPFFMFRPTVSSFCYAIPHVVPERPPLMSFDRYDCTPPLLHGRYSTK